MQDEAVQFKSEQRGSHWVAWAVSPGQSEPTGSVIMVGQTREEAEERVRVWWAARGQP